MLESIRVGACLAALLTLAACTDDASTPVAPGEDSPLDAPRLSQDASSECHGWPGMPFSTTNVAELSLGLKAGDLAVDFELPDPSGTLHKLSDQLVDKPVFLVTGSFT